MSSIKDILPTASGGVVVTFAHEIGSRVRLKAIDTPATVTGCMFELAGLQYRLVWWSDGCRKCEWVQDFEIAK